MSINIPINTVLDMIEQVKSHEPEETHLISLIDMLDGYVQQAMEEQNETKTVPVNSLRAMLESKEIPEWVLDAPKYRVFVFDKENQMHCLSSSNLSAVDLVLMHFECFSEANYIHKAQSMEQHLSKMALAMSEVEGDGIH